MDVYEAIMKRRSIRSYLEKPIEKDIILKIAKSGLMAPSASNFQPWNFIFVVSRNKIREIGKGYQDFISRCSLIIVGTINREISRNWNKIDLAIALQNMVLYCTSVGLGTCWVGSFNRDRVRKLCKVPSTHDIMALITVGYPDPSYPTDSFFRKELDETFYIDEWDVPISSLYSNGNGFASGNASYK
ncbi:MAG: nitroreductase family protein [Promethearchaeota archaeon]